MDKTDKAQELWARQYQAARAKIDEARRQLDKAAKNLAKKLKFKNYDRFSAVFAGNGIGILTFNDESGDLDLDLLTMSEMTKKQVQDEFASFLTFQQMEQMV